MIGPGKYDELCTKVREEAKAAGAVVIIFGGEKGSGFSAQLPEDLQRSLPGFLRLVAQEIAGDGF
jgi:hypothetical protein